MHQIPRRRFVKGLFLGTAFSSIVGKSWKSGYAATVSPASQMPTFQIKISDYPALQEEIGSVRLGVNPVGSDNFPSGFYYPVIINRNVDGTFYVLDSTCTHAGCVVGVFGSQGFFMRCPCHNSLYGIDGALIQPAKGGSPDQLPLRTFDFDFDGADTLTVIVPDMGFTIKSFLPDREPGTRFQIGIETQWNAQYELRFREKLNDPWVPAMFSVTPNGPATESVYVGDGSPVTLYFDRTTPTGFYAAAMRLSEV